MAQRSAPVFLVASLYALLGCSDVPAGGSPDAPVSFVDAQGADAGSADAGNRLDAPDAPTQLDAGSQDASASDAPSQTDAGGLDAGSVDASVGLDAGAVDASVGLDAGRPDGAAADPSPGPDGGGTDGGAADAPLGQDAVGPDAAGPDGRDFARPDELVSERGDGGLHDRHALPPPRRQRVHA